MARHPDHLAGGFETENTGGLLSGFLAEEDDFDRRALWRLGSWGAASVGAVIVAVLANQSSFGWRRDQVAATDLTRQSQQIQSVAKETLSETRRLASAIDTLNGDRDRLYARVTVLEQGLDSATGAIARQNLAAAAAQPAATGPPTIEPQPAAQNPHPAPVAAAPAKTVEKPATDVAVPESGPATVSSLGLANSNASAATPAAPLMASKSMMAPPDPAAAKLLEPEKQEKTEQLAKTVTAAPMPEVVAAASPAEDAEADSSQAATPKLAVQRTEFGVDVGSANSLPGLRALWRGLLKSKSNAPLTTLRPIIVVRENTTGLGMQLRLIAGPLSDAAAAAKICAVLIESNRTCETAVFDGQRLAMNVDEQPAATAIKPAKPVARRRSVPKRVLIDEPLKKPDSPSTLSSLFGRR
jgi:hypothetical protein